MKQRNMILYESSVVAPLQYCTKIRKNSWVLPNYTWSEVSWGWAFSPHLYFVSGSDCNPARSYYIEVCLNEQCAFLCKGLRLQECLADLVSSTNPVFGQNFLQSLIYESDSDLLLSQQVSNAGNINMSKSIKICTDKRESQDRKSTSEGSLMKSIVNRADNFLWYKTWGLNWYIIYSILWNCMLSTTRCWHKCALSFAIIVEKYLGLLQSQNCI